MVTRYEFLQLLAARVTDELITTNIGGVAKEWYHLKDRSGNLYRVYMGGAAALAFGLAVARAPIHQETEQLQKLNAELENLKSVNLVFIMITLLAMLTARYL